MDEKGEIPPPVTKGPLSKVKKVLSRFHRDPQQKIKGHSPRFWVELQSSIIAKNEEERLKNTPEIPDVPIPVEEIPTKATELLGDLSATVKDWKVDKEATKEDGAVVKTYRRTLGIGERGSTYFEAQVVYKGNTPIYGNLDEVTPDPKVGLREKYFQVRSEDGKKPSIYYVTYPFHHEKLGKPRINTQHALENARKLLSLLQMSS